MLNRKEVRLFILLGGFFIANALLAEFIGAKIFSLEKAFGFKPLNIKLFGVEDLSFNMTAGVVLWPVVFIMTDIINEYYGKKGVRMLSFLTVALASYAYLMIYLAIELPPANFWEFKELNSQLVNLNTAFRLTFGQGLWIIIASLVAFLIGQFVDVFVFQFLKSKTGNKFLWLRATGSTVVSQFIDSFIVLFIAFYIGSDWGLTRVLAIGLVNYIYKFSMAVLLTPSLYILHNFIDSYLGEDLARRLTDEASSSNN